ncbi:hypothetical protein [Streptomyces sp. MJP52]|uniref:hypothetical protein n=1 Tax=Streptomyces sp. MJP52 TaxID=2940555 RepID=UPI00247E40BC|nr:hypothetical protein [Streptomyces sp. MJP52]
MTVPSVPQRPAGPDLPQPPPAPAAGTAPVTPAAVPPHASEAGRLLCAGAYLDSRYRDRVIEELWLNEQRVVAPSLGFDAARVLAHALRARRVELAWALGVTALWAVGVLITQGLLIAFLFPGLLLALAARTRGGDRIAPLYRRVPAFLMRWAGRLILAVLGLATLKAAFGVQDEEDGPDHDGPGYGEFGYGDPGHGYPDSSSAFDDVADFLGGAGQVSGTSAQAWLLIVVLAALALCAGAQRIQFARVVTNELSPGRFPDAAADPAELQQGARFQRLMGRIRREQHQNLVLYNVARPFCGAGTPVDTWILAVELRPAGRTGKPAPISNRVVLDRVRPLLEELRTPPQGGRPGRDRLRGLEVDECVFLPAEGLRHRDDAPYGDAPLAEHIDGSVEEGAERRRHFLRIRVGGWEEELVVTVFVRVHTQGKVLMLEVAPHVLAPVREDFQGVDRAAHRLLSGSLPAKAAWAVARVPGSLVRSLIVIGTYLADSWSLATGGNAAALAEGPSRSVRELGAADDGSLFQRMDAARYLKAVQDRVAHGVRQALADGGYQTDEFVQQIVNVSNGGVHIDSVEGSTFAVGEHARASSISTGAPAAPGGKAAQKGSKGHEQ